MIKISAFLDSIIKLGEVLHLAFKVCNESHQIFLNNLFNVSVNLFFELNFFVDSIKELELLMVVHEFFSIDVFHDMCIVKLCFDLSKPVNYLIVVV